MNELSLISAIAVPNHDESLIATEDGPFTVQGYAYNGGGRMITRVEISLDSDATWRLCKIHRFEKPTVHNKHWCWIFWEFTFDHQQELALAHEIVVRGWDESHNTQPDKPTWNLMGMLNNPWFVTSTPLQL